MSTLADPWADELPVTPEEAKQILEKLGTVDKFTVNGITVDQPGRLIRITATGHPMALLWGLGDLALLRTALKTITEETDAIN